MAKKKSSSSKITITKATTVKTPTIKSYTPSKAVNAAKSTLQKTEKARPAAYTSKYGTQITGLADAIEIAKVFPMTIQRMLCIRIIRTSIRGRHS